MRLWLKIGAVGLTVLAGAGQAAADDVATPIRDQIEERFATAFFSPQTTLWHFDTEKPYISGDHVVCGWVNFQSAQQTYVGYHQFYAIVSDGKVNLAQIDDPVSDVSGELSAKLKVLCGSFKRPG